MENGFPETNFKKSWVTIKKAGSQIKRETASPKKNVKNPVRKKETGQKFKKKSIKTDFTLKKVCELTFSYKNRVIFEIWKKNSHM